MYWTLPAQLHVVRLGLSPWADVRSPVGNLVWCLGLQEEEEVVDLTQDDNEEVVLPTAPAHDTQDIDEFGDGSGDAEPVTQDRPSSLMDALRRRAAERVSEAANDEGSEEEIMDLSDAGISSRFGLS